MVAEPVEMPVTIPVLPTPATVLALLVQFPPATESDNAIELPIHTLPGLVMEEGSGLTVTVALPVMLFVQPVVVVLVAVTLYVPAAVIEPKLIELPVPDTGLPTDVAPLYNW